LDLSTHGEIARRIERVVVEFATSVILSDTAAYNDTTREPGMFEDQIAVGDEDGSLKLGTTLQSHRGSVGKVPQDALGKFRVE